MDPSEPADLPFCEAQLRGIFDRVRAAFFEESYPASIDQTLEVMPDLLEQLNLLRQLAQAHLEQLPDNQESVPSRVALEGLRKNTDRVLRIRFNVQAAATQANEARAARDAATRLQTFSELQEERSVAGEWEDKLIDKLQAIIDSLHKINQRLRLAQVNLPRPDPGGGAMASNQPNFDALRRGAPRLVT